MRRPNIASSKVIACSSFFTLLMTRNERRFAGCSTAAMFFTNRFTSRLAINHSLDAVRAPVEGQPRACPCFDLLKHFRCPPHAEQPGPLLDRLPPNHHVHRREVRFHDRAQRLLKLKVLVVKPRALDQFL